MSFQTGLHFGNAAKACATLESISGLEPSTVMRSMHRYLKLVTALSLCPFTLISVLLFGHKLGLLGTVLPCRRL